MGSEGVLHVTNLPDPTLTRYHGAAGANTLYSPLNQAEATTYFNNLAPWGLMGRISIRPDGSVASKCNTNLTPLQTGDNCYSDTYDTGGEQKIAWVPPFCYAVDTLTTNQVWRWIGQIGDKFRKSDNSGDYTFSSSDIHPAFNVDGKIMDLYLGAFPGYYNATTGVLQSIAGVTPTASLAKSAFRGYAELVGPGWEISSIQAISAVIQLAVIETADLHLNADFLYGNSTGPLVPTGYTSSYGNQTYNGGPALPASYRGLEDPWGGLNKYAEGILLGDSDSIWIAPQTNARIYTDTADLSGVQGTKIGAYTNTGSALPTPNWVDYVTSVFTTTGTYGLSWGFIPSASGVATNATYFCNGIYNQGGSAVISTGGAYTGNVYSNYVGPFAVLASDPLSAGSTPTAMGARLQYLPS